MFHKQPKHQTRQSNFLLKHVIIGDESFGMSLIFPHNCYFFMIPEFFYVVNVHV